MALVENWMPPSHENWELITYAFQFFPLVTIFQWINDFYPQGKSSIDSKLNVPGKIGWATMEAPGFITMLYIMYTVPQQHGLTWQDLPTVNKVMAALFVSSSFF
jgi:3-oxo-5-alpha-steroid 4-dehydrogenase 1